jgi:hypothetical protein
MVDSKSESMPRYLFALRIGFIRKPVPTFRSDAPYLHRFGTFCGYFPAQLPVGP